jgi:hypothetical protein
MQLQNKNQTAKEAP